MRSRNSASASEWRRKDRAIGFDDMPSSNVENSIARAAQWWSSFSSSSRDDAAKMLSSTRRFDTRVVVLAAAQVDRLLTRRGIETRYWIGIKKDDPVNNTDTAESADTAFRFLIERVISMIVSVRLTLSLILLKKRMIESSDEMKRDFGKELSYLA